MNGAERDRRRALRRSCPQCGAPAGVLCRDKQGRIFRFGKNSPPKFHAGRFIQAKYAAKREHKEKKRKRQAVRSVWTIPVPFESSRRRH